MCSVGDCKLEVKARGFCSRHLRRFYKYGDPLGERKLKERAICEIDDCEKEVIARGICQMHYRRWSLYGDPSIVKIDYANKKPETYKAVIAHGHPNASSNGIILEHRLVMSRILGRPLMPNENVHHKNGDRKDNRPENLELWNTAQPAGQRVEDKIEFALMILKAYAPNYLQGENRRTA